MLTPGAVIGRYELVCPIADGGMAHVWAARQQGAHGFERIVAMKIIHSRYAEDLTFRAMFLDEARIVLAIEHPNVARLYDVGAQGEMLYLVLEHVDGDALFGLVSQERTVPVAIALRIAAETCAGLQAVHALVDAGNRLREVVHRDVSPQNVLLSRSGEVKLVDFGIAHARDRAGDTTDAGTVKGKVRYMAPEQVRREPIGPWTDVFGVGATLFRMLAGRAPYAAEDDAATLRALVRGEPPLVAIPNDLPPSVVAVLRRAIAPNVHERFATAHLLGDALEQALSQLGAGARPDLGAWVDENLSDEVRARRARVHGASLTGTVPLPPLVVPRKPAASPPQARPPAPSPATPAAPPAPKVQELVFRRAQPKLPGHPPEEPYVATEPSVAAEGANAPNAPAAGPGALPLRLAVVAVVLVVLVGAALVLLPYFARRRATAIAYEAGLDLKVEKVGIGFGGVTLRRVQVKALHVPGLTATMDEVFVAGLSASEVRIVGLDARLEGPRSEIEVPLAMLLEQNRARFAGSESAPRKLTVAKGRLGWSRVVGAGSELGLRDVGFELTSRGTGAEDARATIGEIRLKTEAMSLGPWACSVESGGGTARLRLAFDPPVPEGPSALAVLTRELPLMVTVTVPRSPFTHLGITPAELGIPTDAKSEVEAKLEARRTADGVLRISGNGELYGLRPAAVPRPVDVRFEGSAAGPQGKPVDLDRVTVAFGPFVALVTGTVEASEKGLRVDALFNTVPLGCDKLARAEAKTMGTFAATLEALGQSTGAVRVTGKVNASGIVKYDSAAPDETSVTWVAKETCGVSLFGL